MIDRVREPSSKGTESEPAIAAKHNSKEDKAVSKSDGKEARDTSGKKATETSSWIESRRPVGKRRSNAPSPGPAILNAAVEKARGLGTVEKIKICRRADQDEWWISMYHPIGAAVDVKRFVWDLNSQTLKPFLVIKRVTKSKLDEELKKREPGTSCEIISLRLSRPR